MNENSEENGSHHSPVEDYLRPYLWLIGDHFVAKLSTLGQPTRPTQPSIPLGSVISSYSCIYMDHEGVDHSIGKLGL